MIEGNFFKLKAEIPIEKNDKLNKNDLKTEESIQQKEISETNANIKDEKSVASEKDLVNKGIISSSVEAPKGKAADKIKDKNNINVTEVNKSAKNNSLKGILDLASLNKILNSKLKKNVNNNSSKTNNKVNISVDSSLNKSNISNNKANLKPLSMKGASNDMPKSKDNNLSKINITSKIPSKVTSVNKDKSSNKSVLSNINQSNIVIPKDNKELNKSIKVSSAKYIIEAEKREKQEQIKPEEKINENPAIIEKLENIENIENIENNNINETTKEFAFGGIILNKTNRNSFEDLSELKQTFTEKNLTIMENNHNQNLEIQEKNSGLNKEDFDKIKQLEEKRKKLYSKLGYDIIEPQENMTKSINLRQRRSDLDVFQNVNVKKLAKLMEQRSNGLNTGDDIDENIKANIEEKAANAEKTDANDFIKVFTNKEKRKPTQKRFSLV